MESGSHGASPDAGTPRKLIADSQTNFRLSRSYTQANSTQLCILHRLV